MTLASTELFKTACSGDTWKAQTVLSAPGLQSYIDYPLFKTASKGHAVLVAKLMTSQSNVDLAKTTDAATPHFIAAQHWV